MRIVVHGGGFVNKGAEAMTRTLQAELARHLPDVELFLWRIRPQDCKPAIRSGLTPVLLPPERSSQHFVSKRRARWLWSIVECCRAGDVRSLPSLFNRKQLLFRACKHYLRRTVREFDAFIDISGFAYGDAWGVGMYQRVSPILEYCRARGKPAVFLPQAWGSFDKPGMKEMLRDLLAGGNTTFYSRDKRSCRYLEAALGKPENSIPVRPDIAFAFSGGTTEQGRSILGGVGCSLRRPIIGIAPNTRIYDRVDGQGPANVYVQTLVRLIHHLLEKHDVDVVLQANEVDAQGRRDDDRRLCELVATSANRPDRCFMIREVLTAESTSALIGCFDFLIGARFHSLVFGLSQGVPAIAMSWSHKYRELFALFGLESCVQEYQEMDCDALVAGFERGWSERQRQRTLILERARQLQAGVSTLFDEVATTIRRGAVKQNA
jgi:polysaccharide pyruvyl transferase WcaK-like protein